MNHAQTQRPAIADSLTWRILDGDAVIVSPRSGKIQVLNQSGALIWQWLATGKSTAEILSALVDEYTISPEQAHLDLETFLTDLTQRGLVTWQPTA